MYQETDDQLRCIEEIKKDMEMQKPMEDVYKRQIYMVKKVENYISKCYNQREVRKGVHMRRVKIPKSQIFCFALIMIVCIIAIVEALSLIHIQMCIRDRNS